MLKLSSSRGVRIDVPVLPVSWSVEDHSVLIQALKKGLIEHEASDTGGVPRWKSSCPNRLAEATKERKTKQKNSYIRAGRRPSPEGTRLLFAGTISPMICPDDGPTEGRHDKTRRKA